MLRSTRLVGNLFCAGSLLILSACTSVVPVKDVALDKTGYLKKFSTDTLRGEIVKKVPVGGASAIGFREVRFTGDVSRETTDGKKQASKVVLTLIKKENGLFQEMAEHSSNDIPYSLHYSIGYRGIMPLKWQHVNFGYVNTSMIYEVKNISDLPELPIEPGRVIEIGYVTGSEVQLVNLYTYNKTCKVGKAYPASQIHAKLEGQAIDIDCESFLNSSVSSRQKHAFLQSYGFAIKTEFKDSVNVERITITDAVFSG